MKNLRNNWTNFNLNHEFTIDIVKAILTALLIAAVTGGIFHMIVK